MGAVDFGIPRPLTELLRERLSVDTFVETGTFKGDTAGWAAGQFRKVWTIEADAALGAAAVARFAGQPNVTCVVADSRAGLRQIMPQLDGPALFWLDAHWCGTDETMTAGAEDQCPLLEELSIINASPYEHVILVDDARFFLAPPPPPNELRMWPDAAATIEALKAGRADRYVGVIDDVFIRVPMALRGDLQEHVARITAHRVARAKKRDQRPMRRFKRFLKGLRGSGST